MTCYWFHLIQTIENIWGEKKARGRLSRGQTDEMKTAIRRSRGGSGGLRHWRWFILQNETSAELWLLFPERCGPCYTTFYFNFYWWNSTELWLRAWEEQFRAMESSEEMYDTKSACGYVFKRIYFLLLFFKTYAPVFLKGIYFMY